MGVSRRVFLKTTAAAGAAGQALIASADAPATMPRRPLGRTGAQVSLLGFGCGSRFLMYDDPQRAIGALHRALDAGVNYIDTAAAYGKGESERRVGLALKGRREQVWLATKIRDRSYDDAMRTIEQSLRRLQTDQVDLVHIHSLSRADDLAAIEGRRGVLKAIYEMRDQKMARFIGVTSHTDPIVLKKFLERHDFDCTQMALNAALMGNAPPSNVRGYGHSFENVALPVAVKKKMGIIAMKVFAQERILPDATPRELVRYAMSLPIASAVVGMPKLEHIDENCKLATTFTPMSPGEMKRLSSRVAAAKKASIDGYFQRHEDQCDVRGREVV